MKSCFSLKGKWFYATEHLNMEGPSYNLCGVVAGVGQVIKGWDVGINGNHLNHLISLFLL